MTSDDKNNSQDLSLSDETLADDPLQGSELTLEDTDYVEPEIDVPDIMGHLDDLPDVDAVDIEEVLEDEPLRAASDDELGEPESDFDEFPSDEEDWDDEEPGAYEEEFYGEMDEPAKSAKLKKGLAPVLILVAAVGVGAYLVMSPPPTSSVSPPSASDVAQQAQEPIPLQIPDMGQVDEGLPQPVTNVNQIPRPPGEDDFLLPTGDMPQEVEVVAPALPEGSELQEQETEALVIDDLVEFAEAPPSPDLTELLAETDITEPAAPQNEDFTQIIDAASEPVTVDASEESLTSPAEMLEDMGQEAGELDISEVQPEYQPPEQQDAVITEEPVVTPDPAAEMVANAPSLPGIPVSQEASGQLEPVTPTKPAMAPFPDIGAVQENAEGAVQENMVVAQAQEGESLSHPNIAASPVPGGEIVQPDVYFDSRLNVPQGNVASLTNLPRKVDPSQEPGSKMVVVSKTASADDFEALVVAAGRALKLERYGAAADMYESLYALNPRDPRVLMGQAVAYQNLGRIEGALKIYDELLEIKPDNADALVNMLGILRQQYPEVALRRLMILQEKHPGKASISAQLGIMEADIGNFEEAMRYLGRAASIEPRNAQHVFNLAVIADRARQKDLAIKYYENALEVDSVYGGGRSVPREQIYDRLAILRTRS